MEKLRRLVEEGGGQGTAEYVLTFMSVAVMSTSILTKLGLKVAGLHTEMEVGF